MQCDNSDYSFNVKLIYNLFPFPITRLWKFKPNQLIQGLSETRWGGIIRFDMKRCFLSIHLFGSQSKLIGFNLNHFSQRKELLHPFNYYCTVMIGCILSCSYWIIRETHFGFFPKKHLYRYIPGHREDRS